MTKKIKTKYLLFSAFLFIFLFLGASFVLALEVQLPGLKENASIGDYVVFIYNFLLGAAGTLATISFAVGAVGYIMSGDNTQLASNSKDRMKGAILGVVLICSSWLILNTINTSFTQTLTITKLTPTTIPTPPPQAGVYYFSQAGCAGNSSAPNISSQSAIDPAFKGNIKSVKIVDDATSSYGVIFHADEGLFSGGICSLPITKAGCQPVNISAAAADIFQISNGIAGDGVVFYSEPYGWDTGSNAGSATIKAEDILPPDGFKKDAGDDVFKYNWDFINQPEDYKTLCKTFKDCPFGSIRIKGTYLVGLYSSGTYCQTFSVDVPNLLVQSIVASGTGLGDVYIIPTQQ